jgi:hypothetical protein
MGAQALVTWVWIALAYGGASIGLTTLFALAVVFVRHRESDRRDIARWERELRRGR